VEISPYAPFVESHAARSEVSGRRSGVIVVAIKRPTDTCSSNPESDDVVRAGDQLVVARQPQNNCARIEKWAAQRTPVLRRSGRYDDDGAKTRRAALAATIRAELAPRSRGFTAAHGRPPGLSVVWPATGRIGIYVRNKLKAVAEARMQRRISFAFRETASVSEALAAVAELNRGRVRWTRFSCSRRCPRAWASDAEQRVFDSLDPAKDVDGFHPDNVGRHRAESGRRWSRARRSAASSFWKREGIPRRAGMPSSIGRSDIVGKPMALAAAAS
jgi:hypothetical protein